MLMMLLLQLLQLQGEYRQGKASNARQASSLKDGWVVVGCFWLGIVMFWLWDFGGQLGGDAKSSRERQGSFSCS